MSGIIDWSAVKTTPSLRRRLIAATPWGLLAMVALYALRT